MVRVVSERSTILRSPFSTVPPETPALSCAKPALVRAGSLTEWLQAQNQGQQRLTLLASDFEIIGRTDVRNPNHKDTHPADSAMHDARRNVDQ